MFKYLPMGDSAFLIKIGNEISIDINKQMRAMVLGINRLKIFGLLELIPAYNELMVCYDPLKVEYNTLVDQLRKVEGRLSSIDIPRPMIIHIPVCYDFNFAPDIGIVADTNSLDIKDVIHIHSSVKYLVYMLGFTPGFCYLGGMDSRIATPRKETPRQLVVAGSVGIAGDQTGIYPINSPGGWQIIGKTPLKLFDPQRKPEFLIESGNFIKFNPVTSKEFQNISSQIEGGKYEIRKELTDAKNQNI